MATPMKELLSLLLLACVCTVHGGDGGASQRDVCTQGMEAVRVFLDYRHCSRLRGARRTLSQYLRSRAHNFKVENLRFVLTYHCSELRTGLRQCFEENIQHCSAEQQGYLMTLAQQTGFMCQPNTTTVSPQMEHVLSRLTDADLAHNISCQRNYHSELREMCQNRLLAAMGIPSGEFSRLESLTIEELAPRIPEGYKALVECRVTQIRDDPDRCQWWRGDALHAVEFVVWPVLGNRMTFTNQEIDRMFEWNSPARRDDTGGLDDFMQLTEEWP